MKNQRNTASLSNYLGVLLKRYGVYISALIIIAFAAAAFNIAVDYKIKEIIDTIALKTGAGIHVLLGLFILYKLLHHGVFFIQRLLDIKYKPVMLTEVVTDMYSKAMGHSLHWFDSHLSGEISSKIIDFQNSITTLITASARALNKVAIVLISILFLSKINLVSTAVIVIFVAVYTPVIYLLLRKQMQLQEHYTFARQKTVGIINDSIVNIFGIKIIGNRDAEFSLKLTPALQEWRDWDRKTRVFDAWFVDNADTIMITVMSAVQIFVLAHLYQTDQITAGGFAFVAMITLKVHGELDQFLEKLLFEINPGIATLKSSYAFVSTEYDTKDKEDSKLLSRVKGNVTFDHVTFAYEGNNNHVLHDFSLEINAGERLGIVGTSGAGKTTLIKCLLRYFDVQGGAVRVDGENIADVTQESLRANISVIPQDITMFHRTILENLQLAKQDASLEEIMEACKKAKIHDDIMAMGKGYDSTVGERGVKVSGGQRQRIAIARAILKNAPILILDEATSALDTPTEKLIQESLNEVLETSNATVIAIAHRLSTLKHMDRIIVLDKGTIMEEGSHEQLLAKNGLYKRLWEMQAI